MTAMELARFTVDPDDAEAMLAAARFRRTGGSAPPPEAEAILNSHGRSTW